MLKASPKRVILSATCLVCAASYAWCAIKTYRAERLANRSDQASIERGIALVPQNATYHDLLCRNMIFSLQGSQAVEECQKAASLNPYRSTIWLDLAQAHYLTGNAELTKTAIRQALMVDPTTPDTAWSAANFFLIQGDTADALKEFAIVLRQEPSLVAPALNVCWQSLHDVRVIESILPPNPGVYLALIRLLSLRGELEPAGQVWAAFLQLNKVSDFRDCLFYIDSLLRAGMAAEASDAWKQLSSKSADLRAYSQPDNLIMDGSFTQEILNSGFGWRYTPEPQISALLDTADFHSGNRSLRLTYSGHGSDAGIFQYVATRAGMKYRLSAWVKSENLETANGPALVILDRFGNEVYGATKETTGTTEWHRVETEIETGVEPKLLKVAILRSPGETRIQGKFWVDDVVLAPL